MTFISDSEHFQRNFKVLVLIQKDFRTNCEVISEFLWIRAKFRENIMYSSESKDNSEWITELALNQTNSVQNVTWFSQRLSTEFWWELGTGCAIFWYDLEYYSLILVQYIIFERTVGVCTYFDVFLSTILSSFVSLGTNIYRLTSVCVNKLRQWRHHIDHRNCPLPSW